MAVGGSTTDPSGRHAQAGQPDAQEKGNHRGHNTCFQRNPERTPVQTGQKFGK